MSFWVDEENTRKTTVRAKLIELGASLRDGKVVDAAGDELYFYLLQQLVRDWKAVKADQQILREKERKYHVVRMYRRKRAEK
jgi:hypothetical protein